MLLGVNRKRSSKQQHMQFRFYMVFHLVCFSLNDNPFATTNMSKFKDERVYFRISVVKSFYCLVPLDYIVNLGTL